MRASTLAFIAGLTACSFGQAAFEIQGPPCVHLFPVGCAAGGDPESISGNGVGFASVDTANGAGMPCAGLQYLRVGGHNPGAVNPPAGGPAPGDGLVNEVYIPIPTGAQTVTLCWEFHNAEGGPASFYNDGASIEITPAACGPAIQTIAYADTFSALGAGIDSGSASCATYAPEIAPNGPQTLGPIPLVTSAAFLRVKVWNGGDDALPSVMLIDGVTFAFAPVCTLSITAPFGPGSIAIVNSGCAPGDWYIMPVTLAQGSFPYGWCFGLDIGYAALVSMVSQGAPFSGILNPSGGSAFVVPAGIPAGFTVFAVTATFTPGFGQNTGFSPPVAFITP